LIKAIEVVFHQKIKDYKMNNSLIIGKVRIWDKVNNLKYLSSVRLKLRISLKKISCKNKGI